MSYNKKSSLRSPKENSFDEISEDEKKKITIKIKKENLVRKQDKHVSLYYDIEEVIGEGSFGKVYKIKHKKLK